LELGAGTFNVTGCITGVTASACNGSNNVALLSDDFQSVQVVPAAKQGLFQLVFGQLQGNLNPLIASYFGVPVGSSATSFNILMSTASTPGHRLYGINRGGTIKADPPVHTSEEWGVFSTLGLFALAVASFGVVWRLGLLRPVVQ
jgi:hypothetical protein